jgi:phosphoenolpyruvate synthase/pyruvate phosphate dikinase
VLAHVVWLDGSVVDAGEVGERAASLARLRAEGVPVPRSFVLGRGLRAEFTAAALREAAREAPVKLPALVHGEITGALRTLAGSCAIRRSPLGGARARPDPSWLNQTHGGRPERETYLNLTDVAEVGEAVRRVWGQELVTDAPHPGVAIIVQRFMTSDVCAAVRRDPADPDVLHIHSSLGVGDLLAAGLVVPDRHTVRRRDGATLACSLGRKAQMTVPRPDGGVVRVPVPAHAARRLAMDDDRLRALHVTWATAEEALPGLNALALSHASGHWFVTSAVAAQAAVLEEVMLG